jgi:flagellar hook-length control protein FliK
MSDLAKADAPAAAAPRDHAPAAAVQAPRDPMQAPRDPMPAAMRIESAAPPTPATPPPQEAPPPRPAPIAAPARQVAPFAVALALGPDARLDLTLDPVELGRVEVAIERQGKEAVVSLRAERPETLAMLQRERAELERALSDAGLRNAEGGGPSLSFGLGGEGTARQDRRALSQRQPPSAQRQDPAPQALPRRGLIDLAL